MAHLTTATKSLWMSPFLCVLARPKPLIRCLSWQGVLRVFGMGTSLYVRQSSTISALHVDSDIYIAGALTSLWAWQNQLHCCQRAGKWSGMEWDVWGVAGATDSTLTRRQTKYTRTHALFISIFRTKDKAAKKEPWGPKQRQLSRSCRKSAQSAGRTNRWLTSFLRTNWHLRWISMTPQRAEYWAKKCR